MTKEYLVALADVITGISDVNERIRTAVRIGGVCAKYNPQFDWRKWDKACRVDFKQRREDSRHA